MDGIAVFGTGCAGREMFRMRQEVCRTAWRTIPSSEISILIFVATTDIPGREPRLVLCAAHPPPSDPRLALTHLRPPRRRRTRALIVPDVDNHAPPATMAFAPRAGCPMCSIVATAQHGPSHSPRSPNFPPGSKAPEVLWRDDNFTIYRERASPVSSKGHLIIVFKCVAAVFRSVRYFGS